MFQMSLEEIQHILDSKLIHLQKPDTLISGISTDSRNIKPGNLFVALRGEHFDGHKFIAEALKNGAGAALVDHPIETVPLPQIIVNNTLNALGKLSTSWREHHRIPLIAVTGSNGKTTLKNMIAAILIAHCQNNKNLVLATEGNFNNDIGLPLTLLRLNQQHQFGVIEMGMNHFGEIAYLTGLTQPDIAIITNAAECHLAGVENLAGVARAKGEIFQGLSSNGIAILNRDDAFFDYWKNLIGKRAFLTFGLDHPADISAAHENPTSTIIKTPAGNIEVNIPLLGKHNIMNALAATAAAIALKMDLTAIKQGLESVAPAPGRMREYILANGTRIIDDTYNANPFSLQAAINTLANFSGTKIMVLGDMKELGPDAKQIHFNCGEKIRAAKIDYLFTLGDLSQQTSEAFGTHAQHFTEHDALFNALQPFLKNGINLLVKGSRSMKMEKIINKIIPENQNQHAH